MDSSELIDIVPKKISSQTALNDFKLITLSRALSVLGRKEVLLGKAKFGIFGDGKELVQAVMHRYFRNGDYRSGYYRDQTLMLAQGLIDEEQFFSALYADLDIHREPMSGGRQMNSHYFSPNLGPNKEWISQTNQKNHFADVSSTSTQMPRIVGLAHASVYYRNYQTKNQQLFSKNGNEIIWGTIGNASTSEGLFLESFNALGVHQGPVIINVWDDDYGISVENSLHTTKESISKALAGFQRTETQKGFEILTVNGWDYLGLIEVYSYAEELARKEHVPVLIHVKELTQPSGHSTSGSHERYKSMERLNWEKEFDCNRQMKKWLLENQLATLKELEDIENEMAVRAKAAKNKAWAAYQLPIKKQQSVLIDFLNDFISETNNDTSIQVIRNNLLKIENPTYRNVFHAARQTIMRLHSFHDIDSDDFNTWFEELDDDIRERISSDLYAQSIHEIKDLDQIPPKYGESPSIVDGRIIIRDNFDALLLKHDHLLIFGEDVGKLGDVNQGVEGLQKKYGEHRVFDTSIREASIIGQGIGLAHRGFRPIAEIQYLDYLPFAISVLMDDLACLFYRTKGRQIAPLIIRTRGHRLEGIWHSGSQMGGIVHLLRGMYILVPRNMTQAAGFYNLLLNTKQPALIIEPLNCYRAKEKLPHNLGEFTIPFGKVETLISGQDVTIISYGSTLKIIHEAEKQLRVLGIEVELIDIQSLIPFDIDKDIAKSLSKTNRLVIVDEDVPGGATAYILQQLMDKQHIFPLLDAAPVLLSAKAHRPAYGSDGDYFSKPSSDDVVEAIYQLMHESNPRKFPSNSKFY
ncbi:MAG: thiamine pyrophosphate-dependent enzyme [Flavobacteriaceae bacterium]|nr:thiamine pyrophosphate-dependent enzyme [Flavobacteriaceae bacterium]MCY4266395.1 thiamine pyrophosphate-dependent enzyme [Flavobacteriaceae bacterium]